jgi:phosphate starvation-inducible membrane PsiE
VLSAKLMHYRHKLHAQKVAFQHDNKVSRYTILVSPLEFFIFSQMYPLLIKA